MSEEMFVEKPNLNLRKIIPWLIVAGVILFVLFRYVWISEEVRVHRLIKRGVKATENRSVFQVGNLLASDYSDAMGFDRSTILGVARDLFQNFDKIEVEIKDIDFEQPPEPSDNDQENIARVRIQCSVILHQSPSMMKVIDDDPALKQFVVIQVVKKNGRWLVQRIEFKNIDIVQSYS